MCKFNLVSIRIIKQFILLLFLSAILFSKVNYAQDAVAGATRRIVEGRESVSEYVGDIKQKYKPNSAQYTEARKRYRTTLARFNEWAAFVERAIRLGKTKDLQKDIGYQAAAAQASQAAKDFIGYVESKTRATKREAAVFDSLDDKGIQIWSAVKDRTDRERQKAAEAFYEDVKWDEWEILSRSAQVKSIDEPIVDDSIMEVHAGDPLIAGQRGLSEVLILDEKELAGIKQLVSGEAKGPVVNSKVLAMETLNLAKEYVEMKVSRKEPPAPTKVKSFLALYGLPFRYGKKRRYVPYCAAGVGFASARAYSRLINADPGDDYMKLRDALPNVTRDYAETHPATMFMMAAAKSRTHPNGESYWVSYAETPQKGWLVFFNWSGNKSKTQHVGIVDSVESEGRILRTVEFNTSDTNPSNGGKVLEKTRSVRYVVGYIRTYPSDD